MKFKITKSFRGSPDGFTVIEYKEGDVVELAPSLAAVVIEEGWGVVVKEKATKQPKGNDT